MMTSQRERSNPRDTKIWKQNIEYFTDTIVMMQVAKDAVDADILADNVGTTISHAPHDIAFYKR